MAEPWESAPIVKPAQDNAAPWEAAPIVKAAQGSPKASSRNPDGTYGTVPEGFVLDPETGQMVDTKARARRMGARQGAIADALGGLPFVGEWFDEGVGAVAGPVAAETTRQAQKLYQENYPGRSLTNRLAAGVAVSGPALKGGAQFIEKGGSMLSRAARALGFGAATAGAEGAVSGAGRSEGQGRLSNAATDGAIGAAAGGVVSTAAPMLGAGVRNLVSYIKKSDIGEIARRLGTTTDAAKLLKGFLQNDDFDAAERVLRDLGDDGMIADVSPGATQALDTAMQSGGNALRVGREAIEGRAAKSRDELVTVFDDVLGAPEGAKAAGRGVSRRTAPARKAAYDRAYAQPIDYASDGGRGIEAILQRVPPRTLNAAIGEANEAMRAAGVSNRQIMAEIGEDGEVVFREMPNVQQLDEIKKALGNIAQENTDDFGRLNAKGQRANSLAGELRDALGKVVPQYDQAVKLGGDKIAEDNALRLGLRALRTNTTPEDVAEAMRGASVEARDAFRKGLRQSLDSMMDNVRAVISDPNVDAREARKAIQEMSSRANRAKVRFALGEADAAKLFRALDREAAKLNTRAGVARNSATAARLAGREAAKDLTRGGVVGDALEGKPIDAAQSFVQALTGRTSGAKQERLDAALTELTKVLTTRRGTRAQGDLRLIRRALEGQPLTDAQAERIGRMATEAGILGAYQAGSQLQAIQ